MGALVTRAACQLAIWCLQRHRGAAEPVDLEGLAGLLEFGGEPGDGLGADFGVIDAIDAAQGLFGVPGVSDLSEGAPASSSPRSLVRRTSLQRG